MLLLTNFPGSDNHLARLRQLASDVDDLVVFSPFLARDPARLLDHIELPQLRRLRVVTAMEPRSLLRLETVAALEGIRSYMAEHRKSVHFSAAVAERLHGKVYIFSKDQTPYAAIVTSANFTARGLNTNYEWGVEVTSAELIGDVLATLDQLPVIEISGMQIQEIFARSQQPAAEHSRVPEMIEFTPLLSLEIPVHRNRGAGTKKRRIWIKPSGVTGDPVRPGDVRYSGLQVHLHFSKVRPSGVSIGDLLVVYGVGAGQLMGLFEVSSAPRQITSDVITRDPSRQRWPWYVEARNRTPLFSAQWWEHGFSINSLLAEFFESFPDAPATAVGGRTLGGLNYGLDKIRLSPEFGTYLVGRLEQAELSLSDEPV